MQLSVHVLKWTQSIETWSENGQVVQQVPSPEGH